MAFYTTYRPSNFKTIVGQEQVKDILKAEVNQGKVSSSYIFFGPRGTGKTSTARIFTKAVNCLSNEEKPCNKCENCKLINEGKTLDFVEIDAASNTQVDKIREEIIDKSIYPPTTLKKKVYIIDEVHMLSKSAFNALLKIMEEPPKYLTFILATTEVNKVPETIISRCEVFNFQRISQENIIKRLEYICNEEGIKYEKGGLELIAKIADGGLRDAIKYLEQVSIIGTINTENVTNFLGIAPEKQIVSFLETIKSNNIEDIFSSIKQLQKEGVDLGNFIKDILLYLDDNLIKDLDNNLKIVHLFDKVYSNIKNFPTPALAYKTIIGMELLKLTENENIEQNNKTEFTTKSNISGIISDKDNISDKKDISYNGGDHSIKGNNNSKEEKEEKDNIGKITKDILIKNLKSPVIRGIIKNFGNIETNKQGEVKLIIISKPDYNILNQEEKIKDLLETINELVPGTKLNIEYVSKEDYLNSRLQN